MEWKQVIARRLELLKNSSENAVHPSLDRETVSGTEGAEVRQSGLAGVQGRALMHGLMEAVCTEENMQSAYKRVKRNKGVSEIDGMEVREYAEWYTRNGHPTALLTEGQLYAPRGQNRRNPQAERRGTPVGNTHGHRLSHPTSDSPGFKSDIRENVFRLRLRISTRT